MGRQRIAVTIASRTSTPPTDDMAGIGPAISQKQARVYAARKIRAGSISPKRSIPIYGITIH